MTLVHCSGPEATEARIHCLGAEDDRPSWREACADDTLNRREREMVEEAARQMRSDPEWMALLDGRR